MFPSPQTSQSRNAPKSRFSAKNSGGTGPGRSPCPPRCGRTTPGQGRGTSGTSYLPSSMVPVPLHAAQVFAVAVLSGAVLPVPLHVGQTTFASSRNPWLCARSAGVLSAAKAPATTNVAAAIAIVSFFMVLFRFWLVCCPPPPRSSRQRCSTDWFYDRLFRFQGTGPQSARSATTSPGIPFAAWLASRARAFLTGREGWKACIAEKHDALASAPDPWQAGSPCRAGAALAKGRLRSPSPVTHSFGFPAPIPFDLGRSNDSGFRYLPLFTASLSTVLGRRFFWAYASWRTPVTCQLTRTLG